MDAVQWHKGHQSYFGLGAAWISSTSIYGRTPDSTSPGAILKDPEFEACPYSCNGSLEEVKALSGNVPDALVPLVNSQSGEDGSCSPSIVPGR